MTLQSIFGKVGHPRPALPKFQFSLILAILLIGVSLNGCAPVTTVPAPARTNTVEAVRESPLAETPTVRSAPSSTITVDADTVTVDAGTGTVDAVTAAPTIAAANPAADETLTPSATQPAELPVTRIPLSGPLAETKAEVSSMTWHGDQLILLPQYPERMSDEANGALFSLTKQEVLDYLDGKTSGPLTPHEIKLVGDGLSETIAGFEGFEAIAFDGDVVYLTVEANMLGKMHSFLVRGTLTADGSELDLDTRHVVQVPLDVQFSNFSNEALLIYNGLVLVFYEANGAQAYPEAKAKIYTPELEEVGSLRLPPLEYRLTDATLVDEDGRFWVTNFFFPLDLKILPSSDPLAARWGKGPTHAQSIVVERLVELQLPETLPQATPSAEDAITLVDRPPLQLQLAEGQIPRNWEGIARLDERGFLLVTDKFPETILAFVPAQ